ncbi:cell wall hydrolase [Neorhizobium sp. NCHU2750]|nr:cell wall hydrolase [Neorhizobium sp. NCHU2750]
MAVSRAALCLAAGGLLSACTSTQNVSSVDSAPKSTKLAAAHTGPQKTVYSYTNKDRECLKRAMYFESERSSENGFLAVGSVIMNRLTSGMYAPTICGVVAQKNQFAPGVMTRKMDEATAPDLNEAADAVLKGARHPGVKDAMFFHTQGYKFPYNNMHYVAAAGGNVFYEKRDEDGNLETAAPKPVNSYILAYASNDPEQNPALSSSVLAEAASMAAAAPQVAAAAPAAAAGSIQTAAPAQTATVAGVSEGRVGAQPAVALATAPKPPLAPVITAAIARASMDEAFDTAYSAPQNSSYTQAHLYQASLESGSNIPVPAARPRVSAQKRQAAGMAMADSAAVPSQENWAMRTGDWQ